ncbi:hypothetical protein LDENG_00048560 [Lucifuga dentata]|nr:hypothetical protein LDENG_00048560 [Lucifuga dentata]
MWRIIVFLYIRTHCTVSSLSSPVDVIFSSINLRNVLQWHPANNSPVSTHFTVQYTIYGDRVKGSAEKKVNWRQVWQCTDVARNWCDLTKETWDVDQGYYARVRAVGRKASSTWAMTQRFDPKSDTSFGPPLLSLVIEEHTATIILKGPMRHQPDNHCADISMRTLYPHMTYNISVRNTHRNQTYHFPVESSQYEYRLMDYDTEYCFSAKTRFLSMPVQCLPSEWHCITTPKDPLIGQLQRIVIGIVIPAACICVLMVVGYLLYHYLRGTGTKSPHILKLTSFQPNPLTFPPEKTPLVLISVIDLQTKKPPALTDSSTSDPKRPKQQPLILLPALGYTLQRPRMPSDPDEPEDDSPLDYRSVEWVPETNVGRHGEERGGGEDGNHLDGWKDENESSQISSYHPQNAKLTYASTQTHTQVHNQTHTHREMSTLLQAHTQSQEGSALLSFPVTEIGMEKELEEKRCGKIKGRREEGNKMEKTPLFSAYTAQHFEDRLPSSCNQWDSIPDDYGVLELTTTQQVEEGEEDEEEEDEEEEGTTCVNWDPETRKLVLREAMMELKREEGLDRLMGGEKEEEEEEEEEEEATESKVRLENVFVRQASKEEAELQRGTESKWEVDDIETKWNLVVSMNQ